MVKNKYTLHDCLDRLGYKFHPGGRACSEEARVFHQSIGEYVMQNPEFNESEDAEQFYFRSSWWVATNSELVSAITTHTGFCRRGAKRRDQMAEILKWVMEIMHFKRYRMSLPKSDSEELVAGTDAPGGKRKRGGYETETPTETKSAGNGSLSETQHEDGVSFADAIVNVRSLGPNQIKLSANMDIGPASHTSPSPIATCPHPYEFTQFTKDQAARTVFLVTKVPGPIHAKMIRLHECLTLESFQKRVLEVLGLTEYLEQVKYIGIKFDALQCKLIVDSPSSHNAMLMLVKYWGGWNVQSGMCIGYVEAILKTDKD